MTLPPERSAIVAQVAACRVGFLVYGLVTRPSTTRFSVDRRQAVMTVAQS